MKTSIWNGRKYIYMPGSTGANNRGYILYARYIMQQHLGRNLDTREQVHHIDGNKLNDNIKNLQVLSIEEHARLHVKDKNFGFRGSKRILDYEWIKKLRSKGLGYKKISKLTGYPRSSVKSICHRLERQ